MSPTRQGFSVRHGRLYRGDAAPAGRRRPFLAARNRRKQPPVWPSRLRRLVGCTWWLLPKALRFVAEVMLVAALTYAVLSGGDTLVHSPHLALHKIEVHGLAAATHVGQGEVLARAQVQAGMPLCLLDVQAVTKRVRAHPWVAQATVWRALPHTLHIEIGEHQPQLLVSLDSLYLADDLGNLFKGFEPQDGVVLPVVTGLSRQLALQDPQALRAQLHQAQLLLQASAAHPMEWGITDELHFDHDLGWSMVVRSVARSDGPVLVHLGIDALGRLPVARLALRYLIEKGQRPAIIWADAKKNQGRVQVQLVGAAV